MQQRQSIGLAIGRGNSPPATIGASVFVNASLRLSVMATSGDHASTLLTSPDQFLALMPLMLEEWPQLNQDELLATDGDLDRVITYVAHQTEHTQTLVRRHLQELASLVEPLEPTQPPPSSSDSNPTVAVPAAAPADTDAATPSSIDQLLSDLESRTDQLMQDFKAEMLPELEKKARSNLGMSLLIALGLGVILGLLLGGRRG